MTALAARIATMTTAQIEDAIVEIVGRVMTDEVRMVRVALCGAYEARMGGDAMDALFDRLGV